MLDPSNFIYSDRVSEQHTRDYDPQNIDADLVFLSYNEGHDQPPTLFKLSTDSFSGQQINEIMQSNFFNLRPQLLPLGKVRGLNKEKKRIFLVNGDIVFYHHLVIISSAAMGDSFSQNRALHHCLQALKNALSTKERVFGSKEKAFLPSSLSPQPEKHHFKNNKCSDNDEDSSTIQEIAHQLIEHGDNNHPTVNNFGEAVVIY